MFTSPLFDCLQGSWPKSTRGQPRRAPGSLVLREVLRLTEGHVSCSLTHKQAARPNQTHDSITLLFFFFFFLFYFVVLWVVLRAYLHSFVNFLLLWINQKVRKNLNFILLEYNKNNYYQQSFLNLVCVYFWSKIFILCGVFKASRPSETSGPVPATKSSSLGSFYHLPSYLKLHDVLKATHANYKVLLLL